MTIASLEAKLFDRADANLQVEVEKIMTQCVVALNNVVSGFNVGSKNIDITVGGTTVSPTIAKVMTEVSISARNHLTPSFRDAVVTRFLAKASTIEDQI